VKQVSLSKEDRDETTPIEKFIRKHEVVDSTNIYRAKKQNDAPQTP
jgi:hypothetical protein